LGKNSGVSTGVDATIYPELAQANLLRMRHKIKEAEDLCLSVLRRYPHNPTANTLMGDIAVEKGELEHAAQWYELALDIEPDSLSDRHKLASVRHQIETREVSTTAEQLGLPDEKPKTTLIATAAIAGLVLLGIIAYALAHTRSSAASTPQSNIDGPLRIPGPIVNPTPPPNTTGGGTDGGTTGNPAPPGPIEHELTKAINKTENGAYLIDARYDLQNDGVTLTYTVSTDKDERLIGAQLAFDSFPLAKETLKKPVDRITLRAMRDGNQVYGAVVTHTAYEAASSDDWQTAHKGDIESLAKVILSDEKWAEGLGPPKTTGTEPAATATTGGTTAPAESASTATAGGSTSPSDSTPPVKPAPTTTGKTTG